MTEPCTTPSCRVLIDFAVTEAGKKMPVDHDSAGKPGGTLAVWYDDEKVLRCRMLKSPDEPLRAGEKLGTSHYVTCKRPSDHRRR